MIKQFILIFLLLSFRYYYTIQREFFVENNFGFSCENVVYNKTKKQNDKLK